MALSRSSSSEQNTAYAPNGLCGTANASGTAPVASFFVVRHGQTEFNVAHLVQGWCDSPLTEEGVRIARATGAALANVQFLAAYSSDLGRAKATLTELLGAYNATRRERASISGVSPCPNLDGHLDARLREWCYGDLEGQPGSKLRARIIEGFKADLTFEEQNLRLPETAAGIARLDPTGRAETFDAIEARLMRFLTEAGASALARGGGNVLVVTHSFVIRTLVYLIDRTRVNTPRSIPNGSVTRIDYDGHAFALREFGQRIAQ